MMYVPKFFNPADVSSRLTAQTEWSISNVIFNRITSYHGLHDDDLFATKQITKSLNYYMIPDPKSGKSPLTDNNSWILAVWRLSGMPSKPKVSPIPPLVSFSLTNGTNSLIDYLAEIYTMRKFNFNTEKVYKSSLIQMFKDEEKELEINKLNLFITNIDEMATKFFLGFDIDISSIIKHFEELGPTEQLSAKIITAKTCWFISICGFMRASYLHRIYD
ncbi:hypothetical protein AYI70_g4332 [Smittium culicis]|uniref:Uncharacterized protein n=1 Tax=Smittium culicis TaxID=133412 RepID=A0A1R1XZW9_9FUNG|nr:hypothetical protein AYI70_g4332 [Smittium culicis]